MTEKIREQIMAIRNTGLTNMFDKDYVQVLAYEREMYDLVVFLEEHPREYVEFILYGSRDVDADSIIQA
jgi:hypothetical protein